LNDEAETMKNGCIAITFLGVGIVVVGYGTYLMSRAAESGFAPAGAILSNTAMSMYLFGVPILLIGGYYAINVYMRQNPSAVSLKVGTPSSVESRRLIQAVDIGTLDVTCPDCGYMLGPELGMRRPDGSVSCGRCHKRFIPGT
jgi:hypothetical protein